MKNLRTVKHAFLAVLMLTFYIGCSNDDDGGDADGANSGLVGSWYLLATNGEEANECEKQSNFLITTNGEFTFQQYGETTTCTLIMELPGNYTIDGNTMTLNTNLPMVPLITLNFSISDGILTTEGNDPFSGEYYTTTWTQSP